MPTIFISYKREEEAFARQLYTYLTSKNFDVWLDVIKLQGDKEWDSAIDKGLREADIVVGVLTPESLKSKNVQNEWAYAQTTGKPLFLLWLKDVKESLISHRYIRLQRIDVRDNVEAGLNKLYNNLTQTAEMSFDDATEPDSPFSLPNSVDLLETYGVNRVADLNIRDRWERSLQRESADWPQAYLGVGAEGKPRMLRFSAHADGIHAFVIGQTGSGKSEFLMTLITSLAINYDPTRVRFALLDFKGGAGFWDVKNFPHTASVSSDPRSILGELDAITEEVERRSHLLADSHVKHIVEYAARGYHHTISPFPHLFVVVDEVSELLYEYPQAMELLQYLVRVGRAVGVHLILSCQRMPKEVHLEQLLVNSKLKIAFRTNYAADSELLLGTPAATEIPSQLPGRSLVKVGHKPLEMVQVAHASKHLYEPWDETDNVDHFGLDKAIIEANPERDYLCGVRDWLAGFVSLEEISLNDEPYILPNKDSFTQDIRYYHIDSSLDDMEVPIGILAETQKIYTIHLQHGHILVLGKTQSGKTTFLQSLIIALVTRSKSSQLQIHIITPPDQKLHRIMSKLPHVRTCIDPSKNQDKVYQLLDELDEIVTKRMAQLHGNEFHPNEDMPAILMMIDDLSSLSDDISGMSSRLETLLRDGRICGIYFVFTNSSPDDEWESLYQFFPERIILQLPDKLDYVFALGEELKPSNIAGRGHIRHERKIKKIQILAPLSDYRYSSSDGDAALAKLILSLRQND